MAHVHRLEEVMRRGEFGASPDEPTRRVLRWPMPQTVDGEDTLGLRQAFASVLADASGIRVSNMFATRTFGWDEIERFSVGRWKLEASLGIVELKDGERFGMQAIPVFRPIVLPQPIDAEARLDALRELLNEHKAMAAASSP
jgi:Bacterial PH domain